MACRRLEAVVAALLATLLVPAAFGQDLLRVSAVAWRSLTPEERAAVQRVRVVEIREAGTYGVIVDTQGVDESTPGTTGGAALGAAFAEASYIDRALQPGNSYSAKTQLGVTLLGALAGSALDSRPVPRFHLRYAVKLADGEIRMVDAMQADAFRLPTGMCVSLPDLAQIGQSACTHSADDLRRLYVGTQDAAPAASLLTPLPTESRVAPASLPLGRVSCRLGSLPPVQTTPEKCSSIGGETP